MKYQVVLPNLSNDTRPYQDGYFWTEFVAKYKPVVRGGDLIEVWYVSQEWGTGGTASSFFVPRRLTIGKQNGSWEEGSRYEKLSADFSSWPKFEYVSVFPSHFVAGLVDLNPEVMKAAADQFYDDKATENYKYAGLPATRKEATAVVEAIRVAKNQLRLFMGR